MINTRCIVDLDTKLINDILKIDSMVYPEHLQGTFDEVFDRYKANRDIFVLLYDENDLIGYLCLFPIKESLYNEILSVDKLFDSGIAGSLLEQYELNKTYKLYLISAAIRPEYQKMGLSHHLISGFYRYLTDKKKMNNITFSTALSTSVTTAGQAMLKRMGFREVKTISDGYILHELDITKVLTDMENREQL